MVVIGSYFKNEPTDEVYKKCLISPGFEYSTTTITPVKDKSYLVPTDSINILCFDIFEQYHRSCLIEIYRLYIYLILYSTMKT